MYKSENTVYQNTVEMIRVLVIYRDLDSDNGMRLVLRCFALWSFPYLPGRIRITLNSRWVIRY